jgi:hypothetical protein
MAMGTAEVGTLGVEYGKPAPGADSSSPEQDFAVQEV